MTTAFRETRTAYLFLLPYLAVFAAFWAWPLVESALLSFQNTRVNPWAWDLDVNWRRLWTDRALHTALANTLLILAVQVPVMLVLATLLAVALNSPLLRLRGVFRFAFFAPVVVSEVAYAAVFRLLFNGEFGAVNKALAGIGLPTPDWLNQGWSAMAVVMLAVTWRWTGYNAIILLAGLQSIPEEVYEAARLDGATAVQRFWRITVPLLQPVLLFTAVLSVIGTLQLFTEPFLITEGGPGNATETLGTYLYRQGFRNLNFGYASAIAYGITLLAVAIAGLRLLLPADRR